MTEGFRKIDYLRDEILAIVLAGGAGRRLGGVDKGLQHHQGQPLIEQVVQAIEPQVDAVIISANRNLEQYREFNHPVVSDEKFNVGEKDFQGPIAGIVSAYDFIESNTAYTTNQYILVSSCDAPYLPSNLAERLLVSLIKNKADAAVANDGVRNQNLHCLIKRDALPSLKKFFLNDGRALHRWFATQELCEVDFSDQASAFKNLNDLEQINP